MHDLHNKPKHVVDKETFLLSFTDVFNHFRKKRLNLYIFTFCVYYFVVVVIVVVVVVVVVFVVTVEATFNGLFCRMILTRASLAPARDCVPIRLHFAEPGNRRRICNLIEAGGPQPPPSFHETSQQLDGITGARARWPGTCRHQKPTCPYLSL